MIKLVIFDLDGVLVDTRDLHFEALNEALRKVSEKYVISRTDHLNKFDGLSTYKKLDMLSKERGLPKCDHEKIWNRKQSITQQRLSFSRDEKLITIIRYLRINNIKVYVASNSIKSTITKSLSMLQIDDLINGVYSNEDVINPKPHPEIYMRCMIAESCLPSETLIVEDSLVGRNSAVMSGAILMPVKNKDDVTMENIIKYLNMDKKDIKWTDEKMNIIIPMAGAGSRFVSAGYTFPKPLIDVKGKPMIQVVIENLNINANFIYIVRKEHYDKYNLKSFLNILTPNCKIITVDSITEGACCTTLLAEEYINENSLLIANSDQFMEWNSCEFYHSVNTRNLDGSILIFENTHPKYSYVKTDEYGNVTELKEKEVISNKATVGVYYWNNGLDYVKYAKKMISLNKRVNNEFYVAPVYNEAIEDGKIIKVYPVEKNWGLGTPEDLNFYLDNYGRK